MKMTWLRGKILRFKGDHADERMREMAELLHGRCTDTGKNQLTITKTVSWILDAPPRDQTPRLEREEVIEFGSNGHSSAVAAP